ncbi:MAG: hypothetical protein KAR23_04985 [Candidatus Aenigmarchaeota archaeon]|nr:hypothetical protein [Candidatus Aenigmarchaeota archaeon]
MNREDAYNLFGEMVSVSSKQILASIEDMGLKISYKADNTVVTKADEDIGCALVELAKKQGFQAISEESYQNIDIVKSGNYIIIDPIDGTLAFIEHLKNSSKDNPAFSPNLGEGYDYALLIGIVEDGKPRFGCCYNYVTGEEIYIDSVGDITRKGIRRDKFEADFARYVDRRSEDPINLKLSQDPSVSTYTFGSLGLGSLYAQLNEHKSAVVAHFPQQNGLWDILPACVAAEFTGATILDGSGNKISYTDYLLIPKGVVLYTGDKFSWIKNELQKP